MAMQWARSGFKADFLQYGPSQFSIIIRKLRHNGSVRETILSPKVPLNCHPAHLGNLWVIKWERVGI